MIRNIIFDIGEVLMTYRWFLPFEKLGLPESEQKRIRREILEHRIWHELDAGRMDQEQAKRAYSAEFPEDTRAIAYFLDHADSIRVDRPAVWEKLPALKEKGYRLYFLSNYPEELFKTHMKGVPFFNVMEGGAVSWEVHLTKPDPAIYRYLMERYGLKAEECLFLDDREVNTQAARDLGMSAVTITSEAHVLEEIGKLMGA